MPIDQIPTGPTWRVAKSARRSRAKRRGPRGPRGPRGLWRENIEALTVAVMMALVLKHFLVEAYRIPTGSMQPTLLGDESADVFDRILVDKLSYRFRDPERFDVVVFRYPLDRSKNFVKRVVGLPGEQIRILHGDLWTRADASTEWRVLRRPRGVQRSTWKHVATTDRPTTWICRSEGDWTAGADWIRARGDGEALFLGGATIRDTYTDGYPAGIRERIVPRHGNSAQNRVGDLRFEAVATASAGTRWIVIELTEGIRRYTFVYPGPAAPPDSAPAIALEHGLATSEAPRESRGELPYRLPAGRPVSIGVQNLDDLLEIEIDGEVVAALEVPAARNSSSSVTVRQEGEGVDLGSVRVLRDIYYLSTGLSAGEHAGTIPDGHYFMLGDNTQDSSDSREWTFVRWELDDAATEPLLVRGNRDANNPRYVHTDTGVELLLTDEWGERQHFAWDDGRQRPEEPAPFVPRNLVLGRALCVFWPITPWRDVTRLEWVR